VSVWRLGYAFHVNAIDATRCGCAGPAYYNVFGTIRPIISSLDGRATLSLRALTCGKPDQVQDDATMSVIGSIAGEVGRQ
jgi:hypothetical protein